MNRVEELNYNQTKRQFNLILKKSSDKELLDKANLVFAQIDQLYREIIEKKDQEKKQQDVVRYIVYFQNRLKKITAVDYKLTQKKAEDDIGAIVSYVKKIPQMLSEIADTEFVSIIDLQYKELRQEFEEFYKINSLNINID
ncbi:MAG: hypothetical protein HC932_01140 [Thermales bacterium]|nr:hypothetical protein [Thermales bacterium]